MQKLDYPYEMKKMGITLQIERNVYPTSQISELLIETILELNKNNIVNKKILDYGTGAGFLAIKLASKGAKVVALDINPYAVKCAKNNSKLNNVEIDVRKSDCLEAINNEKFDIIVAGMPWDNDKAENYMEMALFDTNGRMKKELFAKAGEILEKDGFILMTYANFMMEIQPLENFMGENFEYEIVKEKIIHDELHYILKIKTKGD